MRRSLVVFLCWLGGVLGAPGAPGQGLSDLIITGATVTRDAAGQDLAYVRWGAEDRSVLEGRVFGVWSRPGNPPNAGPLTRRAAVLPAMTVADARRALEAAAWLGTLGPELDSVLADWAPRLGVPASSPLADRLAALVRARNDAATGPLLAPLAAAHPAVALALGWGWVGTLQAGETTFEVHVADGTPGATVVGRVTVTAGQPALLPAPGKVVSVPDTSPRGELNLRLRWVTPPELRRRLALAQGFEVWRFDAADARAAGFAAAAPTRAELDAAIAAGRALRIHSGPVLVNRFFDDASVEDFAADPEGYVVDDHDRFAAGGVPFVDGSEWAYVVTARDWLGRGGVPSPVGFARACRTLGPAAPGGLRLENVSDWAGAGGHRQVLRLSWTNAPAPADGPAEYLEVFRGEDLAELTGAGAPRAANFLARVEPGAATSAEFVDDSLVPAEAFVGRTLWYAVRSVRAGPCGAVPGPVSAPVLGGLREWHAPEAPGGGVMVNCPRPLVRLVEQGAADGVSVPLSKVYRLGVVRRNDGIDWAEFVVVDGAGAVRFQSGRQGFGSASDRFDFDVVIADDVGSVEVRCQVGSVEGAESGWALARPAPRGAVWAVRFEAAELGSQDLDPGDGLATGALQGPYGLEVIASDPNGWLLLRPPAFEGAVLLVQRSTGNDPWTSVGVGKVSEGRVTVDEPKLREGFDARRFLYRGFVVARGAGDPNGAAPECSHLARPAGSDAIQPVTIELQFPDRAREYRLYRRIDDGPLGLIAQGPVPVYPPELPASGRRLIRHDEVLPEAGAEVCYFGQVLDEHGNASALTPLGCVAVRPRALPAPVLARPVAAGTSADPRVTLRWFCPPTGVQQFEVALAPRSGTNRVGIGLAAKFIGAAMDRPVTRRPDSIEAGVVVLALVRDRVLTPPVGSAELGNGPQFEATFPVVEGTEYDVFITALGPSTGAGQLRSKASASHRFQWRAPGAVPGEELVPWPARPLPPVTRFHPSVQLMWLTPTNAVWPTNLTEGAVAVVLGLLPPPNTETVVDGYTLGWSPPAPAGYYDPNKALLPELEEERGARPGSLLPAVLYRQQVTNRFFAAVSGSVVQVSPLIREVQWAETVLRDRSLAILTDPFMAVARSAAELFLNGAVGRDPRRRLCLLDTHPVVTGARYRYSLVRFRTDGEIAGTVPLGEVEIP